MRVLIFGEFAFGFVVFEGAGAGEGVCELVLLSWSEDLVGHGWKQLNLSLYIEIEWSC